MEAASYKSLILFSHQSLFRVIMHTRAHTHRRWWRTCSQTGNESCFRIGLANEHRLNTASCRWRTVNAAGARYPGKLWVLLQPEVTSIKLFWMITLNRRWNVSILVDVVSYRMSPPTPIKDENSLNASCKSYFGHQPSSQYNWQVLERAHNHHHPTENLLGITVFNTPVLSQGCTESTLRCFSGSISLHNFCFNE